MRNIEIRIVHDAYPAHPRKDWDCFGSIVHWHRRYDLGERVSRDEAEDRIKDTIALPVYMYDHSGITLNTTGFSCPWDSGQVGYIYATREQVLREYGGKYLTDKKRQQAVNLLRAEIETLDLYLSGECYGYEIVEDGEVIDSCWGFLGYDHCAAEAESQAKYYKDAA